MNGKLIPEQLCADSPLWALVISKHQVPNYAEIHAKMRRINSVSHLKRKLRIAKIRVVKLTHQLRAAKAIL